MIKIQDFITYCIWRPHVTNEVGFFVCKKENKNISGSALDVDLWHKFKATCKKSKEES